MKQQSIINNITPRSLILLDEIGAAASTYDGISIAWSIAEYLHESPHQPKTLFATHYHELNELEEKFPGQNYHVSPTRKSATRSSSSANSHAEEVHIRFGIHVARMAGMPPGLAFRPG